MKNLLICLPIIFLSACTCVNYQTTEVTASYCSTKDIKGVDFRYGDVTLKVDSADNEFNETLGTVAKGVVEGIKGPAPVTINKIIPNKNLKEKIQDKVIERLTK